MTITPNTTKAIRKWLASNNFKVGCRLGKEFAYDAELNRIEVASNYDDTNDLDFMAWLRENGLASNYDCITLSILHELGHHETAKYFSEDEWLDCAITKIALANSELDTRRLNFAYWNTPVEFSANQWLIMFCKCFPQKVDELEDIVSEIYIGV